MKSPVAAVIECTLEKTGRKLKDRLKEHQYAVKTGNLRNGIAAHDWNAQNPVDWSSAKAKKNEQHLWKRKVLEAIHIREPNSHLKLGLWSTTKPNMATTRPSSKLTGPNSPVSLPSASALIPVLRHLSRFLTKCTCTPSRTNWHSSMGGVCL